MGKTEELAGGEQEVKRKHVIDYRRKYKNKQMKQAGWDDLTPLQQRFIMKYLENGCTNATQACKEAGFVGSSASKKAYKLLKSQAVQQCLEAKIQERGEIKDFTLDRVLVELRSVVLSNMEDFIEIKDGRVLYKDWADLPLETLRCVQSIKEDKYGISIKLHDKTAAIDKLAKIYGLDNLGKRVKLPNLPRLTNSENAMQYIEMVNEAVVQGAITVEQGSQLVDIARNYLKAIEVHDIEDQLNELRDLIENRTHSGTGAVNNYGGSEG